MATLIINRAKEPDVLVTLGQRDKVLAPDRVKKPGRKEMAENEPSQQPVPKKISEEDAGKQGPVGTGDQPAPKKPAESEGKKNG